MATSSGVLPWTLTMPAGSLQQWTFTFTVVDEFTGQENPYPFAATGWTYVARSSAGNAVIEITQSAGVQGVLIPTSTPDLSQVQLTLNPAATASVLPGSYAHALWMNPATINAYTWVTGSLVILANPQP